MDDRKTDPVADERPEEEILKRQEEDDGRAAFLIAQARQIREMGGPNMLEVMGGDETIREKIVTGEWDFAIAYGYWLGRRERRGSVPGAARSPNAFGAKKRVGDLTEEEFDRLNQAIERGERIQI